MHVDQQSKIKEKGWILPRGIPGTIKEQSTSHNGGNLPWYWVRTCGWSAGTPPHLYTRWSEKQTHSYSSNIENCTHDSYPFFSNFTHSYTWRPEKYTPSSRTSVYTFIWKLTPPRASHLPLWQYISSHSYVPTVCLCLHIMLSFYNVYVTQGLVALIIVLFRRTTLTYSPRHLIWTHSGLAYCLG